MSSVREGVMSRRYMCVGVIDQTGKSSFGLFVSALVFESVDPGFDSRLGYKKIVNLFGAGMPRDYYW